VRYAYEVRSYFPELVKRYLCSPELWRVHCAENPYRWPEMWFDEVAGHDPVSRYLHADVRFYVPDDLMVKVDRNCMAHGLETLSPFQDIHVDDRLLSLPGRLRIHNENGKYLTKYILRRIGETRFPERLRQKGKQGFAIPLDKWLRHDGGNRLREVLLDARTLSRGYFRRDALREMVETYLAGKQDYFYAGHYSMIGLMTFELWHRKYIDSAPEFAR